MTQLYTIGELEFHVTERGEPSRKLSHKISASQALDVHCGEFSVVGRFPGGRPWSSSAVRPGYDANSVLERL